GRDRLLNRLVAKWQPLPKQERSLAWRSRGKESHRAAAHQCPHQEIKGDTMKITLKSLFKSALLATAVLGTSVSAATDYPTKPIRLVVPFSAGGTSDFLARTVAEKLGENLDTTVVVDNRPGAGGNIGSNVVAKADPDGYTLVLGTVGTHSINDSVY